MRKIAAHYIYPISAPPVHHGILTLSDDGQVLGIEQGGSRLEEREGVEFYSGIIVPGFVNAHCHLELSHLQGSIPPNGGLVNFIQTIAATRRKAPLEDVMRAMQMADARLYAGGTVAVGDISNGDESFGLKSRSSVRYHTFIERFGLRHQDVPAAIATAQQLIREATRRGIVTTVTPHAPYSTCAEMYTALRSLVPNGKPMWSIHNQESEAENQLFIDGTGPLVDMLRRLKLPVREPLGRPSIYHTLANINRSQRVALVHNLCTTADDYDRATTRCSQLSWVLCCRSNLYIENRLPPVGMLRSKNARIAFGTDSLASCASLQMMDELKFFAANFPEVPLHDTLTWATLGGARALGMDNDLGSFDAGKHPGAVLLSNLNLEQPTINVDTQATLLTKKIPTFARR